MAVQVSSSIANVSIRELSLDYIGAPALRIGGVIVILDKERVVDWNQKKKALDEKMKLDFGREGQIIVISQKLSADQVVPLSLSKLARSELLKITAAGTAINRAVLLALELTKGNIAKECVGIELVTLSTVEFRKESRVEQITGIEIYLRKGIQTAYTPKHKEVLKMLEQV
jgi:DNA-binding protein